MTSKSKSISVILIVLFIFCNIAFASLFCKTYLEEPKTDIPINIESILDLKKSEELRALLTLEFDSIYKSKSANLFGDLLNAYIRIRLSVLPINKQAKINEWFENGGLEFTIQKSELGSYSPYYELIKIGFPRESMQTIAPLVFFVHELEHLIQYKTVGWTSKNFLDELYDIEKGAMSAEAIFLLSLPKEFLLEQYEMLVKLSTTEMTVASVQQLLNAINNNSVDEYLKANWEQGRYSKRDTLRLIKIRDYFK